MTTTSKTIADELQISLRQFELAVELLIAGNTIPFSARCRKEATDGMDQIALHARENALDRANALAARETTVLKTINKLGLLANPIQTQIDNGRDIRTLGPVCLPFKPKRRTRATIAHDQGLQPLAENIVEHRNSNCRFGNRKELISGNKWGKRTFEQAAGVLRIRTGDRPLENSAIHPQSFPVDDWVAEHLGLNVNAFVGQIFKVKVLEIDMPRKRISVTRKLKIP